MTAFRLPTPAPRRRLNLTPMIDVVFLLLIFFMLASRFGTEAALAVDPGGPAAEGPLWEGPPRLVTFDSGALSLNGWPVAAADLPGQLRALMPAPDAPVLVRPQGTTDLQALVSLLETLRGAGIARVLVVE